MAVDDVTGSDLQEDVRVVRAMTDTDVACGRALILEYVEALDVDLTFQGFVQELATFPGEYQPPRGCLLLATRATLAVGCVAVRPLSETIGELKRLYVRPAARGYGVGRALTLAAFEVAREYGYTALRLDTLPTMPAARALYGSLGFRVIPPYRDNPIVGAQFMECLL